MIEFVCFSYDFMYTVLLSLIIFDLNNNILPKSLNDQRPKSHSPPALSRINDFKVKSLKKLVLTYVNINLKQLCVFSYLILVHQILLLFFLFVPLCIERATPPKWCPPYAAQVRINKRTQPQRKMRFWNFLFTQHWTQLSLPGSI